MTNVIFLFFYSIFYFFIFDFYFIQKKFFSTFFKHFITSHIDFVGRIRFRNKIKIETKLSKSFMPRDKDNILGIVYEITIKTPIIGILFLK